MEHGGIVLPADLGLGGAADVAGVRDSPMRNYGRAEFIAVSSAIEVSPRCRAQQQEQARRPTALVAKRTEQLSASDAVGAADRTQSAQNIAPERRSSPPWPQRRTAPLACVERPIMFMANLGFSCPRPPTM